MYTPFAPYEWNVIKQGLDKDLLKKIRFTVAPKSCTDGKSIILLNNKYLSFTEVFDVLSAFFYHIKEITHNYGK